MNGWAFSGNVGKTFQLGVTLEPGYYLGIVRSRITKYTATVAVTYHNRIWTNVSSYPVDIDICRFINEASGYSNATCMGLFNIDKPGNATIGIVLIGHNATISDGTVYYSYLKLCDVKENQ